MNKPTGFDPERYAISGTEDSQQISLFGWAASGETRKSYPELAWLFAIPNGGYRTKAGAGKLRAMGVKKGVPDIFLPVKRGEFLGLFLELKRPAEEGKRAGQTSPEQKVWIEYLKKAGYGAAVCFGFDHARQMLIDYLNYKKE